VNLASVKNNPKSAEDSLTNKPKSSKQYCYDHPRPSLTVDVVLFDRSNDRLRILLIKRARDPFKGLWAFPGGFVDQNESLEDAASRELFEETGLTDIKIEQIGAFGDPGRDPRGHTVSVAFAAVLDKPTDASAGDDAEDARWYSALHPPRLAFDHRKILGTALKHLKLNKQQTDR